MEKRVHISIKTWLLKPKYFIMFPSDIDPKETVEDGWTLLQRLYCCFHLFLCLQSQTQTKSILPGELPEDPSVRDVS